MTVADAVAAMPEEWAKRRLIIDGPTMPGTDASRMAVIAIAAELRLRGVSEEDTRTYILSRLELFATGTTRGRSLVRQLERSVRFAYAVDTSAPILSGCCRDPRPRAGGPATGKLRQTFEAYCGDACERVCPLLRRIRNPGQTLHGPPMKTLTNPRCG
jgi:hypothetical protein